MDQHDRRIAAILQKNNRCSADEIGEAVGLSASAVHRRIARMREDGLIAADVAVLDPKAFGVG